MSSSNGISDDKLTLEDVKKIHRAAMERALNEFQPDQSIQEVTSKIDFVSDFNKSSLKKFKISEEIEDQLNVAMEENKNLILNFEYVSPYTKLKIVTNDPHEIQKIAISDMTKMNLFSEQEIKLMTKITESFESTANFEISHEELVNRLVQYENEYKTLEYKSDNSYFSTGLTLAIAKESFDWWSKNPTAFESNDGKNKLLPNVVAQDLAGAIVGSAVAAGYQLIQNDDDFDWAAVGYGAVAGAVVGSTGVVGKIAKWFK